MSERNIIKCVKRRFVGTPISLPRNDKKRPFIIAFVYSQNENYFVTGGSKEVRECLKTLRIYGLVNFYYPGRKNHDNSWMTVYPEINTRIYLCRKSPASKRTHKSERDYSAERNRFFGFDSASKSAKFCLEFLNKKGKSVKFFYRKLPKKWLPEWTDALNLVKMNEPDSSGIPIR